MNPIYAVILAGGRGERFWPASREGRPKQMLAVAGQGTMLEETVARLAPLVPSERVRIITSADLVAPIRASLPLLADESVIGEPVGRNTAPAIGAGAALLAREDPSALMMVLPADHHVPDPVGFRRVLEYAAQVAFAHGSLVTFGIVPTRAETGYGYIEVGDEVGAGEEDIHHHRVNAFVEKPDEATARGYLEGGSYLWNSGMFVWRVDSILDAMRTFMPELAPDLDQIIDAPDAESCRAALHGLYERAESISIDYAIMEKADDVVVVRSPMTWDDVGSWDALDRVLERDEEGNVRVGNVVTVDTQRSVIYAEEGIVGIVGLEGVVVVRSGDAVLVCDRDRAQDVKELVNRLKADPEGGKHL